MIIPIAHEDQRGRRWPYVTFAIIALNIVVFLLTNSRMQMEQRESGTLQLHLLALNARYPDAQLSQEENDMVDSLKREHAPLYAALEVQNRSPIDTWDAQLLSGTWTDADVRSQVAAMTQQFEQIHHESLTWNYAFHPYHPTAVSYLTANFLHGGWLHLIFNMWFLWLAGAVLEDAWGRVVYPIFYLLCGVLSMSFHAGVFRGSFMPVVGASGAIAGLMGGFLARFPKTKIKLAWLFLFRFYKFSVPAYVILPLWLAIQVLWGILSGNGGGVAYWVHVGGFAFGMVGAVVLRATGIEKTVDQAIEAKVTWTADAPIVRATELLGENQAGAAVVELQQHVKEKPDSIDGYMMLLKAQERSSDTAGQKETLANLCRLYVSEGDPNTAWNYYDQFVTLGGDKLPRGVWLELCRYLEANHNWDRAVTEYERFAEKNSTERASVPALVSAARICLEKLNRVADAERFYSAAAASPVPHLDQVAAIQEGLKKCAAAAPVPGSYGTR
ncbi:MAG: rhomboid family intramembrane serine protease [Candidatus Acidiferrales bacterium]